jgi:hypothetical protein
MKLCKLIKLSSSESLTASPESLITVASGLSEVTTTSHEVLVAKLPEVPFTLNDLKTGYETIKKVRCCFEIDTVRVIKTHEQGMHKGVSIVEISNSSESADRDILINHFAIKRKGAIHAIISRFCERCEKNQCLRCYPNRKCTNCQKKSCNKCAHKCCGSCNDWFCEDCSYFCNSCQGCCCENCYCPNAGVCNECNYVGDDSDDDSDGGSGISNKVLVSTTKVIFDNGTRKTVLYTQSYQKKE